MLSQKITISSTKRKWKTLQELHTRIPLKSPVAKAASRDLLSLSVTRRKRSGDNGHPCLIHLFGLKKGEAALFIRTMKGTKLMQLMIHIKNWRLNPRWMTLALRRAHSLCRKLWRGLLLQSSHLYSNFLVFIEWRPSWATHCFMDLLPFQEAKLLRGDLARKNVFQSSWDNLWDDFIDTVIQGNRAKVLKARGIINLRNKCHKDGVWRLPKFSQWIFRPPLFYDLLQENYNHWERIQ